MRFDIQSDQVTLLYRDVTWVISGWAVAAAAGATGRAPGAPDLGRAPNGSDRGLKELDARIDPAEPSADQAGHLVA